MIKFQHNRRTKRKLKAHQAQQKYASRLFWGGGCDFNFRFVRLLCSMTRLFLQMTRLLQLPLTGVKAYLFYKNDANKSSGYQQIQKVVESSQRRFLRRNIKFKNSKSVEKELRAFVKCVVSDSSYRISV